MMGPMKQYKIIISPLSNIKLKIKLKWIKEHFINIDPLGDIIISKSHRDIQSPYGITNMWCTEKTKNINKK